MATIAKQIQDAINGSSYFGTLYAQSDGVDTVTITYRTKGTAFTLTDSDGNLTTSLVTAASSGSNLPPGIIVMEDSNDTGMGGAVTVPASSTAVAKVVDVTPTYSAGDEWTLTVTVLGVAHSAMVTMTTDLDTTLDAMAEALDEALPASTVTVVSTPATATKLTLTSEVAGQDFDVSSSVSDVGGASDPVTIATTTANVTAAFTSDLIGVVVLEQVGELPASGLYVYTPGDVIACGRVGRYDVLVDTGETIAAGNSVYVRTTAGASEQLGACRNDTDSGDCLLWSRAKFVSANFTGLDGQNCATIEVYDQAA